MLSPHTRDTRYGIKILYLQNQHVGDVVFIEFIYDCHHTRYFWKLHVSRIIFNSKDVYLTNKKRILFNNIDFGVKF